MNIAEAFLDLFQGSDLVIGRTQIKGTVAKGKKVQSKSWTEKREVLETDWAQHLAGAMSLGMSPIRSDSLCRWGAIDVDTFSGIDLPALAQEITRKKLPLTLCQSKSGGPHFYIFSTEWVPAELMVESLEKLAGILGFGTCEIFPKQVTIKQDQAPDFGNWINMPFFGTTRTAFDDIGNEISKPEEFIAHICDKRVDRKDLENIGKEEQFLLFPDGPPCLNRIFADGTHTSSDSGRNIVLCNAAVYCKKAFEKGWETKLEEYNRMMKDPLPSSEVQIIIKSYGEKDYKYQCRKTPLCNFCTSKLCRAQAHGVGDNDVLSNNRSLTKVNTDPPIWLLDIHTETSTQRITLSTEELQQPRLFQKRCMECLNFCPQTPKQDDWVETLQHMLKTVTVIDIPKEEKPVGFLRQHLEDYIINRPESDDPENLLKGIAYADADGYYFRLPEFLRLLRNRGFTALRPNEITAQIKLWGGEAKNDALGGIKCRYWAMPIAFLGARSELSEYSAPEDPF